MSFAFRLTRPLRYAAHYLKPSTGITGLKVHENPIPHLTETYASTLKLVQSLPASSAYRQGVEAITNHKLNIVKTSDGDVPALESKIGEGQIEELIAVAEGELGLIAKMIEWKA